MRNSMADYACPPVQQHIIRAHSYDDALFEMLDKFFRTNVLSWIEHVIQLGDLGSSSAHQGFGSLPLPAGQVRPSIPPELRSWTIDLPRIVTQFGANLISDPSAFTPLCRHSGPRNLRHLSPFWIRLRNVSSWSARLSPGGTIEYAQSLATTRTPLWWHQGPVTSQQTRGWYGHDLPPVDLRGSSHILTPGVYLDIGVSVRLRSCLCRLA